MPTRTRTRTCLRPQPVRVCKPVTFPTHTDVALRNGGNPATSEVGNSCNQCAGRLPIVDTARQRET